MSPNRPLKALLCSFFVALAFPVLTSAQAQDVVTPSRITQAINESNLTVLHGNTHPLAQARFDQGAVADSLPMNRMLLVLKRSQAQETALNSLLDQQQDPTSPNYHQWLTPQQFGQQFGPSDQDVQTITNWLQSHGFTINGVSNGRTVIEFSGTAGQVRDAFHTEIHHYTVNGADHFANSSDPQIPSALTPVVAGINTLYNFPRRQMHELVGTFSRSRSTGQVQPTGSQFTINWQNNEWVAVAPADFAKIYNVPNLALASPGTYNGDGETIAIVGESDINAQDVNSFRTLFGLPTPAKLTTVYSGPDPGTDPGGAETEADLDVEWAGAVAPNASIDLVLAQSTEASLGVDLAAQYAVDNNLAPVLNESFGICEFFMGNADNTFYSQMWQQASAEGITVTVSSGDGGSAACDQNAGTNGPAEYGLTVSGFTSTPYNISVGGTDFNDVSDFAEFWNITPSDTPTLPSALGYIPEMTWNDTCTNQEIFSHFGVTSAEQSCNNSTETNDGYVTVTGGSGGQSNCTQSNGTAESSCSSGYPKPVWQTGNGVPNDGVRDIPDVSFFASNGFNASFYAICEADLNPGAVSCDPFAGSSTFEGIGGTSASSPAFAAIMALVNQATGSRQGNANYVLYKLAAQSGNTCVSAVSPASTCVFYDVPSGSTIAMACVKGAPDEPNQPNTPCSTEFAQDSVGILSGYSTGAGYDQATGLGSVNAANLISKWKSFNSSLISSTTTLTLNNNNALNVTHGQSVPVTITVTGSGGTPMGTVSLMASTATNGAEGLQGFTLTSGSNCPAATGCAISSTNALPGGDYSVFAQYSGDGTFGPSASTPPVPVSVSPEPSKMLANLVTLNLDTGIVTSYAATSATYGTENYLFRVDVGDSGISASSSGIASACLKGVTSCPTGSVVLTSSGSPLPLSSLPLNSQGYAEIQSLLPGAYSVTASYPGDPSYGATSTSATFTILKAPTTAVAFTGGNSPFPYGNFFSVVANVNTNSLGVAPSGTVSFLLDGSAFAGFQQISLGGSGYDPTRNPPYAELSATDGVETPITIGMHTLTAVYSGDGNYGASTSTPVSFVISKAVSVLICQASPSTVNINQQTTLKAQLDGVGGIPPPTGTFSFLIDNNPISGTVTYSTANGELFGTLPYTPTVPGTHTITVNYSGDANYESQTSGASLAVTGPTFSVAANPAALSISSPGQSVSTTLTFTSQNGLTGSGGFSSSTCGTSASEEITCSLTSFTLPANGTATATLTFSSTAASGVAPSSRKRPTAPVSNAPRTTLLILICALVALAFAQRRKEHRWQFALAAVLFAVMFASVSCGGGSGGSSGGGGPTNPGTPTGAVQPLSVSITINGTTQTVPGLTLTVQ